MHAHEFINTHMNRGPHYWQTLLPDDAETAYVYHHQYRRPLTSRLSPLLNHFCPLIHVASRPEFDMNIRVVNVADACASVDLIHENDMETGNITDTTKVTPRELSVAKRFASTLPQIDAAVKKAKIANDNGPKKFIQTTLPWNVKPMQKREPQLIRTMLFLENGQILLIPTKNCPWSNGV